MIKKKIFKQEEKDENTREREDTLEQMRTRERADTNKRGTQEKAQVKRR